jgi:hypothetical protein
MKNIHNITIEGEIIELKSGNVVIVRLSDLQEIEVAVNRNLLRNIYKVSIGDRFAIKVIDPPRLSRAYALIERLPIQEKPYT